MLASAALDVKIGGRSTSRPALKTPKKLRRMPSSQITRDKNVIKPAKGKRQCNCRNKVVTRQLGPGMIQRFATQECEECQALAYVRESETLSVSVEAGTPDGHVSPPVQLTSRSWGISTCQAMCSNPCLLSAPFSSITTR